MGTLGNVPQAQGYGGVNSPYMSPSSATPLQSPTPSLGSSMAPAPTSLPSLWGMTPVPGSLGSYQGNPAPVAQQLGSALGQAQVAPAAQQMAGALGSLAGGGQSAPARGPAPGMQFGGNTAAPPPPPGGPLAGPAAQPRPGFGQMYQRMQGLRR
jgi:hypothetical protein